MKRKFSNFSNLLWIEKQERNYNNDYVKVKMFLSWIHIVYATLWDRFYHLYLNSSISITLLSKTYILGPTIILGAIHNTYNFTMEQKEIFIINSPLTAVYTHLLYRALSQDEHTRPYRKQINLSSAKNWLLYKNCAANKSCFFSKRIRQLKG